MQGKPFLSRQVGLKDGPEYLTVWKAGAGVGAQGALCWVCTAYVTKGFGYSTAGRQAPAASQVHTQVHKAALQQNIKPNTRLGVIFVLQTWHTTAVVL